jgi:Ca2+-transporting ATPase
MSRRGLRVISLAEKISKKLPEGKEREEKFVFLGLFGIMDDMRKEVPDAVKAVELAGIRVVMITGDFGLTAETIARKAGIMKEKSKVLTGGEIELLSDEELKHIIEGVAVFARVTPDQKLRIIRALQARGEIVAMTGDGVNDALSLVSADLGVSMGKIGTEVAKEASDIVLLDDNFGNIGYAVEEGRNIFRSIKKVLVYLFSTSIGEAMAVIIGLFLGTPLPLLAPHIIWLNFVTDGFFTVALGMEPKDSDLLSEKFVKPKKYILNKGMLARIFITGIPMAIGSLILFLEYYETDVVKGWTMCMTTLAIFQWFNAMNVRSEKESILKAHPFKNQYIMYSLYAVVLLQILAIYTPFMNKLLKTTPLSLGEWGIAIGVASSVIFIEEIRKFIVRVYDKKVHTSH